MVSVERRAPGKKETSQVGTKLKEFLSDEHLFQNFSALPTLGNDTEEIRQKGALKRMVAECSKNAAQGRSPERERSEDFSPQQCFRIPIPNSHQFTQSHTQNNVDDTNIYALLYYFIYARARVYCGA